MATEIDQIVRDNLKFEVAISDLTPRVFVGHGRSGDWRRVERFLEDCGFAVEEYEAISPTGKSVTDRLKEMLTASSFAIDVMSAEDEQAGGGLRARGSPCGTGAPRGDRADRQVVVSYVGASGPEMVGSTGSGTRVVAGQSDDGWGPGGDHACPIAMAVARRLRYPGPGRSDFASRARPPSSRIATRGADRKSVV